MSQNVPSEKDVILALALASGATQAVAAELTDISPRTIHRHLSDPEFRKLVIEYRDSIVAETLGKMASNMTRAADALAVLLDTDDVKVRLRAARAVLSLGMRLRDSVDLSERVRQLEEELARKKGVAS